jgi:hypothetical protein
MIMRNKHTIVVEAEVRCPKESCGWVFNKKFKIEYTTNQKGDVIETKIT